MITWNVFAGFAVPAVVLCVLFTVLFFEMFLYVTKLLLLYAISFTPQVCQSISA